MPATFPVKQAFLAFLQADAVATRIASEACGIGSATEFDPVSMCVMEQFDKATYAKVPLRLTGDPSRPVEVRPDADGDYGSAPRSRGAAARSSWASPSPGAFATAAVPQRPFWSGMELGLKGMSSVLASGSD